MSTPRRDFLGMMGAGGLFMAGGGSTAELPEEYLSHSLSSQYDMSWVKRVRGKHRAVFDAPEPSDGDGLWRAVTWRDQCREVFGVDLSKVSSVLVLRHNAIHLIMDDSYWARFEIGKQLEWKAPRSEEWITRNPQGLRTPGADPAQDVFNLQSFHETGGIILACDLAFRQVVAQYRRGTSLSRDEATAEAVSHVLPGVTLLPSGYFAIVAAQDAGCRYVWAV